MSDSSPSKDDSGFPRNFRNLKSENTVVRTFHIYEGTFAKGKRFAQLLGITHSQLLDKAVEEYVGNHQSEVPVTFPTNNYVVANLSPEVIAVIAAQAATHKLLLKQHVDLLKTALDRSSRAEHLIKLCYALNKQTARTGRFLKSAKGYHDGELLNLLTEASCVVETVRSKTSGGV